MTHLNSFSHLFLLLSIPGPLPIWKSSLYFSLLFILFIYIVGGGCDLNPVLLISSCYFISLLLQAQRDPFPSPIPSHTYFHRPVSPVCWAAGVQVLWERTEWIFVETCCVPCAFPKSFPCIICLLATAILLLQMWKLSHRVVQRLDQGQMANSWGN